MPERKRAKRGRSRRRRGNNFRQGAAKILGDGEESLKKNLRIKKFVK
jgi:hypothetical protein